MDAKKIEAIRRHLADAADKSSVLYRDCVDLLAEVDRLTPRASQGFQSPADRACFADPGGIVSQNMAAERKRPGFDPTDE